MSLCQLTDLLTSWPSPPQDLWETTVCCLQATWSTVICHSSPQYCRWFFSLCTCPERSQPVPWLYWLCISRGLPDLCLEPILSFWLHHHATSCLPGLSNSMGHRVVALLENKISDLLGLQHHLPSCSSQNATPSSCASRLTAFTWNSPCVPSSAVHVVHTFIWTQLLVSAPCSLCLPFPTFLARFCSIFRFASIVFMLF